MYLDQLKLKLDKTKLETKSTFDENPRNASIEKGDPASPQHGSQSNLSDVRLPPWRHGPEPWKYISFLTDYYMGRLGILFS